MAKYVGRLSENQIADKKEAQQQIVNLVPSHPHLVCFDMDGHLLDSMTTKQAVVFQPVFMDRYGLREIESFYRLHAENHNLWTEDRGSDRHVGKLLTMISLQQDPHLIPLLNGDLAHIKPKLVSLQQSLQRYCDWKEANGKAYSYDSLFEFSELNPADRNLHQLKEWTFCCDHEFAYVTIPMKPFDGVRDVLEYLHDKADVLIVSKTPYNDICNWLETQDLIDLVTAVAGKEMGDKEEHICLAKGGVFDAGRPKAERVQQRGNRYEDANVIMGGDGGGDLTAARANGAWFFGTAPGQEEQAWLSGIETVFEPFLKGQYGDNESALVEQFLSSMKPRGFWESEAYSSATGHLDAYKELDAVRQDLYKLLKPGGRLLTAAQLEKEL